MRFLAFVSTFFLALSIQVWSQNFVTVSTDASQYPTIQFRTYGFAVDGSAQFLDSATITEDGKPLPATLTRETASAGDRMSCMVMVDVSASTNTGGSPSNLVLARTAANAAQSVLNSTADEIGLGKFDVRATLLHGLTTDKSSYTQALADLTVGRGFSLDSGLLSHPEGGLTHLRNARYNRALLLIVDGSTSFNTKQVIQTALGFRIPVYIIGIRTNLSDELQQLSDTTGGLFVENVSTATDAESYARAFISKAKRLPATIVSYTSTTTCLTQHQVAITSGSTTRNTTIFTPTLLIPYLEWNVQGIEFGSGGGSTKVALLTARNSSVLLTNVYADNPAFTISTVANGTTIKKDQTIEVNITYSGGAIGTFANVLLISDACQAPPLPVHGGGLTSGDVLTLTAPNGGEILRAGVSTPITWTNVLPDDVVRLEYSTDAGSTWTPITETASNNRHVWTPGPELSTTARVRVQRTSLPPEAIVPLVGHRDPVYAATFTYDGRYVLTGGHDATVRMWNATSGKQVYELGNHGGMFAWTTATHPSALIGASGGHDGTVKVYNLEDGSRLNTISAPSRVWSLDFSPDGTNLVIGTDRSIIIVNWSTGETVNSIVVGGGPVYDVKYSHDGSLIVSAETDRVAVRTTDTYAIAKEFAQGLGAIYAVDVTQDNSVVATGGADFVIRTWNPLSGNLITSSAKYSASIQSLDFSPSSTRVVAGCSDGSAKIFKTNSLDIEYSLASLNSIIYAAEFSPDANRVVTAGTDDLARVWNLQGAVLAQDQSDADFSITGGSLSLTTVDHGDVFLGDGKEVLSPVITNNGSDTLAVNGWRIVSGDLNDITVSESSKPTLLGPGKSLSIETQFRPTSIGARKVVLQVNAGGGSDTTSLTGRGVAQTLVVPDVIDFGRRIAGQSVVDTTILLRAAPGGNPIIVARTVLKGVQQGSYQITSNDGTFTVPAGQTAPIGLQFAPGTFGRFAAWIEFTLGDGSVRTMRLYGEGTGDARIRPSTQTMLFATNQCKSEPVTNSMSIGNSGNSQLVLYSIEIAGVNEDEFEILEPTSFPVTINTNESISLKVQFTPRRVGTKDATITISSNAIDALNGVTIIPLIARMDSVAFELSRQTVLFEGVNEGDPAEQRITIFNTGTIALRWPGIGIDKGSFRIEPPTPPVTMPGASSEVTIRFKGGTVGNSYTATHEFVDTLCGRTQTIQIEAIVKTYIGCVVAIDTVSGAIGTTVSVPVRILNKVNFDRTNVTEMRARIKVNGTILTPNGVQSTFESDGSRTFDVTLPIPSTGDVSTNLTFTTTWGNDTASYIRIDSAWTADTIQVKKRDGQVQLNNLCREGGPRLLLRERALSGPALKHEPASVRVVPAPVLSLATVELHVVEEGLTHLDLIDATGKVIMTLVDRSLPIGDYLLPFDSADLENGMYTMQLTTRTQRMSHQFPIVR